MRQNLGRTLVTGANYNKYALRLAKQPGIFTNLREVTARYELEPGLYVIIPSTFKANKESRFYLRVYTEKDADME